MFRSMRYRLRTLLVLASALNLVAVGLCSTANADNGLNGRWKAVAAMEGGKPVADAVGWFAIFMDRSFVEENAKRELTDQGHITLDLTATPARIDARSLDGDTRTGIFVLRGDSLEICWGYSKRPESLDSSKDPEFFYVNLDRVPEK